MSELFLDHSNKNDTNEANLARVFADSEIEAKAALVIQQLIERNRDCPLTVIQLDMDKSIEIRRCGIDVKLAVLTEIGSLLLQLENENCIVIPHGTRDDVTIVCVGMSDPEEEAAFTSGILKLLSDTPVGSQLPQGPFHVTYSAGIASYPATAKTAEQLMELADGAVRLAKKRGRNSFCVAETGYHYPQQGVVDDQRYQMLRRICVRTGKSMDEIIREGYELLFQKHAALYRFCDQEFEGPEVK